MVTLKLKLFFSLLIFSILCFLGGCSVDLGGLFASTPLNDRLEERNNFQFLTQNELFPSFGEEYSFLVLADTHIEDGNTKGLEKIATVIENSLDTDGKEIKFAVVAGDITQNGAEKDIKKFIEIARSFGVPCYPVIGNHDIYFNNWSVWRKYIGSTRYIVDGGETTLFILDSANDYFGKEQLDWLEKEIKGKTGNVFVFTHSNLFAKGFSLQQTSNTAERARILSVLKNKCNIMFTGHSHERSINRAGGVEFIGMEDFAGTKAYCIVSVTKSGIEYEFYGD